MADDEQKRFNGIILPEPFRNLGGLDGGGALGSAMGITARQLEFGPQDIVMNFARPEDENYKLAFFWLDNCPKKGPYSLTGCYYWLLPQLSDLRGGLLSSSSDVAVRVRPRTSQKLGSFGEFLDYGTIFWQRGRYVEPSRQYSVGRNAEHGILPENKSFHAAINIWEHEEYNALQERTIAELRGPLDEFFKDSPKVQLEKPRRKLAMEARDATWPQKRALIEGTV